MRHDSTFPYLYFLTYTSIINPYIFKYNQIYIIRQLTLTIAEGKWDDIAVYIFSDVLGFA